MNFNKYLASCAIALTAIVGISTVADASVLRVSNVTTNQVTAPFMNFQDEGSTEVMLNGVIFWTALPNESYFDEYVVGFADAEDNYISTIVAAIPPYGGPHELSIADTAVPAGATRIGVFISSNGVLNTTPVYSTQFLNNPGGPPPISFEDTNPLSGFISGPFTWLPVGDESFLDSYFLGFADDQDNLLSPFSGIVNKTGGPYTINLEDVAIPTGATRLAVFMVQGGVTNPIPPFSTGLYDVGS